MGREVIRVAIDFDWPLNKVYEGRLMPDRLHGERCADCKGGQTAAGWWLQTMCQRLAMLATDITDQDRGRPMHPWLEQDPYPAHTDGVFDPDTRQYIERPRVMRPGRDMAELLAALTGKPVEEILSPFGLGGGHELHHAIVTAAGLPRWGECTTCDGHGSTEKYPGQRADADAWTPSYPPPGDGWQLWETTSEGSPIGPVFATSEGLAQWLTTLEGGRAVGFGHSCTPMTIEQARRFVGAGWSPTMVSTPDGEMQDGATWVANRAAAAPEGAS